MEIRKRGLNLGMEVFEKDSQDRASTWNLGGK